MDYQPLEPQSADITNVLLARIENGTKLAQSLAVSINALMTAVVEIRKERASLGGWNPLDKTVESIDYNILSLVDIERQERAEVEELKLEIARRDFYRGK